MKMKEKISMEENVGEILKVVEEKAVYLKTIHHAK